MPRWSSEQWRALLATHPHNGIECTLSTHERTTRGVISERIVV
jgi:hypothetical protein